MKEILKYLIDILLSVIIITIKKRRKNENRNRSNPSVRPVGDNNLPDRYILRKLSRRKRKPKRKENDPASNL